MNRSATTVGRWRNPSPTDPKKPVESVRTFKRKTGETEVICPKCYHCFKPMT